MIHGVRPHHITPALLEPYVGRVSDTLDDLLSFCPSTRRMWSTAPVRAAACVAMLSGVQADYVRSVYRALVVDDFATMPKGVQAFYKMHAQGRMRRNRTADVFIYGLKIFDPAHSDNERVLVKDMAQALARARETLTQIFGAPPATLDAGGSAAEAQPAKAASPIRSRIGSRRQACIDDYIALAAKGTVTREDFMQRAQTRRAFEREFGSWHKFKAAAEEHLALSQMRVVDPDGKILGSFSGPARPNVGESLPNYPDHVVFHVSPRTVFIERRQPT
jgi:hypothetical protein